MTIDTKKNDDKLTCTLNGRLDTTTAPELEAALKDALDGIKELTIDISGLAYISSAGLRVLLATQKRINAAQATMIVRGASESIMEVFDITGFTDILTLA